jgi:lipid-binding SYLF domain-containing protein
MKFRSIMAMFAILAIMPLSANAASRAEQQASIQKMRTDVLTQLYRTQPGSEQEVRGAYGTAVFSNAGITAFFITAGYGYGVARNNKTGQDTYMQMGTGGLGLGLGVKDFRAVFLFRDEKAYRNFVNQGLDMSGHIDAAAKAGTKGKAVTGAADVMPGVRLYQLTETGLVLQATVNGTKYWKDSYLNSTSLSSNAAPHPNGYNN